MCQTLIPLELRFQQLAIHGPVGIDEPLRSFYLIDLVKVGHLSAIAGYSVQDYHFSEKTGLDLLISHRTTNKCVTMSKKDLWRDVVFP
jgi:hypothetical protein